MEVKHIDNTVSILKKLIELNGPSYLKDEPYQVYKELLNHDRSDVKTAAAVLYLLSAGVTESIEPGYDAGQVSKIIQTECSLNKKMADKLALILTSLFSENNRKEWEVKDRDGLRLFLKEEFVYTWNGFAVWDAGGGTVNCNYEAKITMTPIEMIAKDKELTQAIEKNPFMTKEAIHDFFVQRLKKYLDLEFEDYCTCDDYYQPVVEDFGVNMEQDLQSWCEENGFRLVSFEGDGDDEGYEPKFRRGWY